MISYDGYNLESASVLVNKLNKFDAPERDVQTEALAMQDGFNIVSDYRRSRTIIVEGTLVAASAADLVTLVDTLKYSLSGANKNLDIDQGGTTRRFKATCTRLKMPEEYYNITHLPYSAEFLCQPFGLATSAQSGAFNNVTTSPYSDSITIVGTYKPQPIITISFDAENTATVLAFQNATTGDTITITQGFNANDVLVINTETHKVTLNGTQIDFSGPIPEFVVGTNNFIITVTSTSHQYDLTISYIPRYL